MFKPFDKYVQVGDSRSVEHGPFTITATVHQDHDSTPLDFDCYGDDAIDAWNRGEWEFVGIVLSISVGSVKLSSHAVSLWGIECNFPTNHPNESEWMTEVANDLLPEAIAEAEKLAAHLKEKLAA